MLSISADASLSRGKAADGIVESLRGRSHHGSVILDLPAGRTALNGKTPEASHLSSSHDDGRNKPPFGKGLATINYGGLEVRKLKVWSWLCVSFSSASGTKVLGFLSNLAEMCSSLGMAITLEPTWFLHATTCSHHTDIIDGLRTADGFFRKQDGDLAKLLVVLQDDSEYSDDSLDYLCDKYGVVCQSCRYSQELDEKYLRDVASEIMFKVLEFTAYYTKVDSLDKDENVETEEDDSSEDEEISDKTPSENWQQHVKNAKKGKRTDCVDLQVDISKKDDEMKEDDGFGEPPLSMDADHSHNDNNDIHAASENWQQQGGKSFTKKRKGDDCDDLQVTKEIVGNWACVCFAPLPQHKVYYFSEELRDECASIGMDFCQLSEVFIMKKRPCLKVVEDMLSIIQENYSDNSNMCKIDLLTVILPQDREFHGKIEEVFNHMGIVCHYFVPMSAISPRTKYLQQAAQEIKNKVVRLQAGHLQPSFCNPIPSVSEPTIIFGVGSFHGLCLKAASLVASRNWPEVSMYRTKVTCPTKSEVAVHGDVVSDFLEAFRKENKKRAERIIIFRHVDGSEFNEHISSGEIATVKVACQTICGVYRPRITYITVSRNKSNDICPAIDGDVGLNPIKPEFSFDHGTVEETVRVFYRVFHDENAFTPDVLRSTCLNLCTTDDRRAVRALPMVPPAYLAASMAQKTARRHESEEV